VCDTGYWQWGIYTFMMNAHGISLTEVKVRAFELVCFDFIVYSYD
jgi:hypothetical protein